MARRLVLRLAALIGIACGTVRPVDAQKAPPVLRRIADDVACPRCRIAASVVRTLVLPADSAAGTPLALREDSLGRHWLLRQDAVPALFGADGRFVLSLGTKGRGPDDFLGPTDVVALPGDSVLVIDGRARRAVVYDAALKAVRHVATPMVMHAPTLVSWPGVVVASGGIPAAAPAGMPLHLVAMRGTQATLIRSFGASERSAHRNQARMDLYTLTTPVGGKFWGAWRHGYRLHQWTVSGVLLRTIERKPPWFRGASPPDLGWVDRAPQPFVAAVEHDTDGLLWVYVAVAAPGWREAWPAVPKGANEVGITSIAMDRMFDTVIEVIDPTRLRVIARTRINRFPLSALPNRRLASYRVSDDGRLTVSIISLEVVGR